MTFTSFRKTGNWKSLLSAFLYFDVSFMIWVLCGAVALYISSDFKLNDAQKALMVSVPTLGGALLRIPMGILADRIGCRNTGLLGMAITFVPLAWACFAGTTFHQALGFGLVLGVAGASFGVALPLASRWYPPKYQGMAMGIAGAGNSGTALSTFFAPHIAEKFGWHAVFGIAMIPLALVFVAYFVLARDAPDRPPPKKLSEYLAIFGQLDIAWFSILYAVTFGGFVGLSTYLGIVFFDIYGVKAVVGGLTKVQVGYLVTATVIAGSFFRPVGGWIADKIGGMRLLTVLYAVVAVCSFLVATMPRSFLIMLLIASVMMACLGMGNGAVFQLVPQRFKKEIGVATGIVGAAGGFGGFALTNFVLGPLKQGTGSHVAGFLTVAFVVLVVLGIFSLVSIRWRRGWAAQTEAVRF
jgi:NNP family nitrate/nitrite transporter-like MFS transporter